MKEEEKRAYNKRGNRKQRLKLKPKYTSNYIKWKLTK